MRAWDSIQMIRAHLADEISETIFSLRLSYSLHDNPKYIRSLVDTLPEGNTLSTKDGEAYIFGCGYYGRKLQKFLPNNWQGFIDNNYQIRGGYEAGLKIYGPEEVPRDAIIYIANKYHYIEIINQLLALGFHAENVINIGKVIADMADRQYFDLAELPHVDEESFVDAGALNGDTSKAFLRWAGSQAANVYCFEPDANNAKKCRQNLAQVADKVKVSVIEKATWYELTSLHFSVHANGTSAISDTGVEVAATSLDEALGNARVTFVKMDIEGAEMEALQGAKHIIRTQHPKLAISVYHKPGDILEIPELILSYAPDYHFYLRHYCLFDNETVLYAI